MGSLKLRYRSWKGVGVPPLSSLTLVNVIHRNGTVSTDLAGLFRWDWAHPSINRFTKLDIVGYRVVRVYAIQRKD